jgi:isoleucyl-tRNA synthetase
MQVDSHGRRSAQSAMYRIVDAFVRWIAPILSFTADELWKYLPGDREANVLFSTTADIDLLLPEDGEYRLSDGPLMQELLLLREAVSKVLEPMRAEGKIGASLAAEATAYVDLNAEALELHPGLADELRFLFITSSLDLQPLASRPADAIKVDGSEAWIMARPSTHAKCVRCWHYRDDVGSHAEDPELCGRCVENVNGDGEVRKYF